MLGRMIDHDTRSARAPFKHADLKMSLSYHCLSQGLGSADVEEAGLDGEAVGQKRASEEEHNADDDDKYVTVICLY